MSDRRFYDILGVPKNVSPEDLKKAYKKAAILNHPDKGGDVEKFKELAQAYEVLSDPEKREIYDEHGEEGLKQGTAGSSSWRNNPFDIFESFFSGKPFGGSSRPRQRRGEDVIHPLSVSLDETYCGASKKVTLLRSVLCQSCKGKGSKSGSSGRCESCQGSGMKVTIRQLGPGMIQQMQHVCGDCNGAGEVIDEKDRCADCKGNKVVQENKVLEVHVEKGMKSGQKITFHGEADEFPDTVTGDVIFLLREKNHPKFKRKHDDLFTEHTLTLVEALCGFQLVLTQLDGRKLLIKSAPGEIIKPGQFKAVNDEGMPQYRRPFVKGRLYIQFGVDFPESRTLSPDMLKTLESVLPPGPALHLTPTELADCEETTLHDVNIEEEMRRKHQQHEAYDDDDEPSAGHRVQCAQQ